MNKKTAGRISAMAMASMMMMSVCVVNAAAEENEPITQLNLKKTVVEFGDYGWKYISAIHYICVSCGEW